MTDENLLSDLRQAATTAPPANFRPGITFEGRSPSEIVTPPLPSMQAEEYESTLRELGYPIPEDMTVLLVEMQMVQHEHFWTREAQGKDAVTVPSQSWRYRFKVVPRSAREDVDIAFLADQAREAQTGKPAFNPISDVSGQSLIINLADFQIGKVDELGGTLETLARSEAALARMVFEIENAPVAEVIIVDNGDSTEGFESAPNSERTNDLSQTEAIRVWRRILWRWIEAIAPLVGKVKVVGVPSNHCRVRRGKAPLGDALDDWGIEVIAQVSDIAKVNETAYGHVEFIVPEQHQEHVLLTLIGGQVLGVAHGHQKSQASQLATWIKSTGRKGLAQADIVVVGHFHHLVVEAFGDQQWLFICPTNDNGSSWFTPSSGERSEPGVLTFRVDQRGWFDLNPIWLGNV